MSIYESWNPDELTEKQAKRFEISRVVGSTGFNTGRALFRVNCKRCKACLHKATTYPPHYIEVHQCCTPICDGCDCPIGGTAQIVDPYTTIETQLCPICYEDFCILMRKFCASSGEMKRIMDELNGPQDDN